MKKIIPILAVFLFSIIGVYAADQTLVSGIIYDMESNPINGASVLVTCFHGGSSISDEIDTLANGRYSVLFPNGSCTGGDTVEVYAEKEGVGSGTATGTVNPDKSAQLNVSFINLSIPEFGLIGGAIAIIGSGIGFLTLRRKHN